ncbi:MAG TPA: sulfite exporter TauE/SafE family protein [Thermodesulfobacteriota bacterium]|nr:sulfite exporter TauE/SafE family protein [Thermodesulfobacteriota bacterium]
MRPREATALLPHLDAAPAALLIGALTIAFAGFVKGTVGSGFPLLATPVLAAVVDPQTTVVAISIPAFVMNLLQLKGDEPVGRLLVRHRRFLGPAALGTLGGAYLLKTLDPAVLRIGLGLLVLGWVGITSVRLPVAMPPARERWLAPLLGLFNGLIGGASGIFFPLLAIYLLALGLSKRAFVQAISLAYSLQQAVQLAAAAAIGLVTLPRLAVALAVSVLGAAGFALGWLAQGRIHEARFRQLVRLLLVVSALQLLYRGAAG